MDLDSWLAHCRDGGLLPVKTLRILCEKAKEILMEESNLVHIEAPVTIVGHIVGKFWELCQIFDDLGEAPSRRYVFLGGIVNKGTFSLECI